MHVRVHRTSLVGLALAATFFVAAPAAAAPTFVDLKVIDATPQVSGRDVSWKVTVQNAGTAKSKKFLVEVYPNSAAAPGPAMRGYPATWVSEGLFSGETKELTLGPVPRANGTFSSWVLVDGLNLVPEADESNNLHGPTPFTVAAPTATKPEIYVASLSLVWDSESKISYIADVYNGGASTTTAFRTNLRYDSPDRANPIYVLQNGATGQNVDNVDGLASGATRTIKFYWEDVPDGIHTSWLWTDVPWDDKGDAVDEEDEDNNLMGPILVLKNLTADADTPDLALIDARATVTGSTVTYEIDVENQGLAAVGAFDVLVALDSPAAPDLLGPVPPETRSSTVASLAAGDATTVTIVWDGLSEGTYSSWALVDPFNQVAEDLETNNSKGPVAVTIGPPAPVTGVDLSVSEIVVVTDGSNIGYAVTVKNNGSEASGAFDVDLVLDSVEEPTLGTRGDKFESFAGLAAGETVKAKFVFDAVQPGAFVSWAVVDTLGQVAETNEANNIAGPKAFTIEPSVKLCADGAAVVDACRCGGNVVQSGWCCGDEYFASACGSTDGDAGATDGAGGDIAVFEPLPEDGGGGDDSGCAAGGGPSAAWLSLLAAALLLAGMRRSRAH